MSPGYLRVILYPGSGMADGGFPMEVPYEEIPVDLRMPNCKFTLLFNGYDRTKIVGIERSGDSPA